MDAKQFNYLLLPNKFKAVGIFLLIPGIVCAVTCFYYGIKPEFLDMKVFAVYSKYFKTNYFSIIENNIIEELSGLFLTLGFLFIIFSKEKNENESLMILRFKSVIISIYANALLMVFSYFFIYGLGFIYIIVFNLISFQLFYLIIFNLCSTKEQKYNRANEIYKT